MRQAAADHGVRTHVPVLHVVEVHRAAVAVRAALRLAVELGHDLVRMRALRERMAVRAVRGGDHVAVLERPADADGTRLLPDRNVQEPGQLTRAEPLLDLLFEAPNQQHFAQNVLQLVLAQRGLLLLHLCHGRSVRFAPCASSTSGQRWKRAWIRGGTTRGSTS